MPRVHIPRVIDNCLLLYGSANEGTSVPVGSRTWYLWLENEQNKSFAFSNSMGRFTARHERQRNHWYWYAYHKQGGKVHKAYLGKPEELTIERLNTVAMTFAERYGSSATCFYRERMHVTHLSVLSMDSNLIARPHLIKKIHQGQHKRLTLLSAPTGSGKTTLLSQYCNDPCMQDTSWTWLSLHAHDNTVTQFWSHFIEALDYLVPGIAETVLPKLFSPSSTPEKAIQHLLRTLSLKLTKQAIFILDDFHVISLPDLHQSIVTFLEQMPVYLHVIIACRSDPPLSLARWRAQRDLLELHADDLRFSVTEISQFLTTVTGVSSSIEVCTELAKRTEGWVAALQLASLDADKGEDILEALSANNRHIMDYFIEEVFAKQTEDIQKFLLHSSILARFTYELCDAIDKRTDSQSILEYLEKNNLFIVALDEQKQWFRYHPLFAEALRMYLQQRYAQVYTDVFLKASAWYQHNNMITEAVQCALHAASFDTAIALIEQYGVSMVLGGQIQTVQHWLKCLPETAVFTHPFLNLLSAYVMLYTYRLEDCNVPLHYIKTPSLKGLQPHYLEKDEAGLPTQAVISVANRATFTEREQEVLELLMQGATNREIASHLTVSEGTVKKHIANICNKLGVKSRTQVVATVMRRLA